MQRTTLGELALWEPPPDETDYFQRFISVIDEFYPDDWRSWEVNNVSYEDLFGDRITSDEECRLRFAVPTLHLAYAFSEGPPSLSERKYKRIKRQLITWPLGRAIIYSPFATMKKIHPTAAGYRFSEVLSELKAQLISRAEAAKILPSTQRKSRSSCNMASTSQKRAHCSDPAPYKKARNKDSETLTDFMKQQNVMLEKLCQLSEEQNENIRLVQEKISNKIRHPDMHKSEYNNSSDEDSCQSSYNHEIYEEPSSELESPTNELVEDFASVVSPETVKIETKLSVAEDNLIKQGIACQRLETDGWQNITYAEAQKKFLATPVFTNLKVNRNLAQVTPPWQLVKVLEKIDLCLGAMTHGLLQQRKEFQEIYQKATLEVKSVISKYFLSSKSSFRRTSDALLQYTCGKRAEVIQQRRSIYKPTSKILHELLHTIPPSSKYLFSEPKFSELVKEHGGIHKFFPDKPKKGRKDAFQPRDVRDKRRSSETYRKPNFESPERFTCSNRKTRTNLAKTVKQNKSVGNKF